MKQAKIMISNLGPGRDIALQAICCSGLILSFVHDVIQILSKPEGIVPKEVSELGWIT